MHLKTISADSCVSLSFIVSVGVPPVKERGKIYGKDSGCEDA